MKRIEFKVTEDQLTKLIKKMVNEAKDEMEMDVEMKPRKGRFDIYSAVKKAAKIFEEDFPSQMDEEDLEELEQKSSRINIDSAISKLESRLSDEGSSKEKMASEKIDDLLNEGLYESYLFEDKFNRIKSIIARVNIFGGLGVIGAAATAFISMISGYVDFEFLTRVHDMVESTGCSRYCGPLSFFIACLGVAMFFHGISRKDYLDSEMAKKRGDDEGVDESYYY